MFFFLDFTVLLWTELDECIELSSQKGVSYNRYQIDVKWVSQTILTRNYDDYREDNSIVVKTIVEEEQKAAPRERTDEWRLFSCCGCNDEAALLFYGDRPAQQHQGISNKRRIYWTLEKFCIGVVSLNNLPLTNRLSCLENLSRWNP